MCACVHLLTSAFPHHFSLFLPSSPQVVSMGLYLGETAYLRSSWNILDGFLVFVSLIDIVVSMAGGAKILGVLRVLRLLRTLRPLRFGGLSVIFSHCPSACPIRMVSKKEKDNSLGKYLQSVDQ